MALTRVEIVDKLKELIDDDLHQPEKEQSDDVTADTSPLEAYDLGYEDGTSGYTNFDSVTFDKIADWLLDNFSERERIHEVRRADTQ